MKPDDVIINQNYHLMFDSHDFDWSDPIITLTNDGNITDYQCKNCKSILFQYTAIKRYDKYTEKYYCIVQENHNNKVPPKNNLYTKLTCRELIMNSVME